MDYFEIIEHLEEIEEMLSMSLDDFKKKYPDVDEDGYYPFRVGYAKGQVEGLIERIRKGG